MSPVGKRLRALFVTFVALAVICGLIAIWTGDERWGGTCVVFAVLAFIDLTAWALAEGFDV